MQKNQITHKRVLELRKTTRQVVVDADKKTAELKVVKQKMTELQSEVACLTSVVDSAEVEK